MPLIEDVREDLRRLRTTRKELKTFGLVVGSAFALFGLLAWWRGRHGTVSIALTGAGVVFMILGFVAPRAMTSVRRYWMGASFVLGWFVSRMILIVLFYGILTPVALAARIAGKKFLEVKMEKGRESYWTPREGTRAHNYERMI